MRRSATLLNHRRCPRERERERERERAENVSSSRHASTFQAKLEEFDAQRPMMHREWITIVQSLSRRQRCKVPPTDVTLFYGRWLPFDPGRTAVDGDLDDIDAGTFQQTPLLTLNNLLEVPCLVLLGQTGTGKTSVDYMAVQALLVEGEHADLLSKSS